MNRCPTPMIHEDKSTAQCVLDRDHVLTDSDHVDEHGHTAKVLVSQATIREAQRMQETQDKAGEIADLNAHETALFIVLGKYGRALAEVPDDYREASASAVRTVIRGSKTLREAFNMAPLPEWDV